jgi:hypothetical protein
MAGQVCFRSHQTALGLLIPDALSRPIIFQRLPGLVPDACLEFCHSRPGGVDVEFLEFFGYSFPKRGLGVVIHILRPGPSGGYSLWKQFADLAGSARMNRTPLRTLLCIKFALGA